jgi:hypothetical protein
MASHIERRKFLATLGGAAAAWPLVASAQQGERMRHIGVLMATAENDSETQHRLSALRDGLQKLGWTEGRNLRTEYRWGENDLDRMRAGAEELAALKPEVIFAAPRSALVAMQRSRPCSRRWPIRSPRALSQATRNRAATSPGSPPTSMRSA